MMSVGAVLACSGGSDSAETCPPPGNPAAACTIDGACRLPGAASTVPCQVCIPAVSSTSWSTADDGTPCSAGVCSAGTCVAASSTRAVTLRFRTLYRPDDGSETAVDELPFDGALPSAVLVADASAAGYASVPLEQIATSTYRAADLPVGGYLLRLDRTSNLELADGSGWWTSTDAAFTELVPLVVGDPDLSVVLAARADLARVSSATPVDVQVSSMEPYEPGSQVIAISSQADVIKWPFLLGNRPPVGSTSHTFTLDWNDTSFERRRAGLPDPARGDVVFWYQRMHQSVAAGTGYVRRTTRYARLDSMSLQDGAPASVMVPLLEAPMTGSISTSARADLFAALSPDVNPYATPRGTAMTVTAVPRSATYPDMPATPLAPLFSAFFDATAAFDLGRFTYGQIFDAGWDEFRVVSYAYDVAYTAGFTVRGYVDAIEPSSWPRTEPAAPMLSPPRAPRVGGANGFTFASGVGTQPVLSWSPPAIGTPTSYVVTIRALQGLQPMHLGELRVTVYGGTSFRVPPGFLEAGVTYYAVITARSAPWDVAQRPPFRGGYPRYTADCLTAPFAP